MSDDESKQENANQLAGPDLAFYSVICFMLVLMFSGIFLPERAAGVFPLGMGMTGFALIGIQLWRGTWQARFGEMRSLTHIPSIISNVVLALLCGAMIYLGAESLLEKQASASRQPALTTLSCQTAIIVFQARTPPAKQYEVACQEASPN